MTNMQINLEAVLRTARLAVGLALAGAAIVLAAAILIGLPASAALGLAVASLPLGILSGGFGIAGRTTVRPAQLPAAAARVSASAPPLRVPQPR